MGYENPVDWLQHEFSWRRLKNPSYSLRGFSKLLGIGSGRLSEILSGKRTVTVEAGKKFANSLGYKGRERESFLLAVKNHKNRKHKHPPSDFNYLDEQIFQEICNWYYLAILNVLTIDPPCKNSHDIADRLGLKVSIARNALRKLEKLGLVTVAANGEYYRTSKPISTTKDIPSGAIRTFQQQILQKAQEAIVNVPAKNRDFSTAFVCLDQATIKKVKDAIESSRRMIASLCDSNDKTDLYALNIQFFPITKESAND